MNKKVVKGIVTAAAAALIAGCGDVEEENTGEGGREGGNNNNLEVDDEEASEEDGDAEASENIENEESNESGAGEGNGQASAEMENTEGESVGTVSFYEEEDVVRVEADIENVDTGYHGFHLHDEAVCEPEEDFTTAEGHYNPDDSDHAEHPGDMPPLLVNEDGTASLSFTTDRFTVEELLEEEVAVMIHEDPDNFGHIPDRYVSEESGEPGPDEETLDTGDAGDRYACGVVEETS
ncbi:MAG: hypothetical protein EA344_13330 [Alkalicoccus sp.]|uniref:Superoxide dismutase [Cu-Zn] n=1 Tax=Alkalicoccus sp. TaxID=2005376 RepID=A0A651DIH5_9BACI|nr:MAG: hypothetical protein EA344_13330 [Alkalicoccus sp.]